MKIYNRLFRGKIGSIWICGLVTTDSHGLTVTIPECDLSGILGISGINIFNAIEWYIGRTDKNGNKIYTGDIVRTKKGRIYKVVLRKYLSVTGYGFDPVDKKYAADEDENYLLQSDNLEIVGNIHGQQIGGIHERDRKRRSKNDG